MPRSFSKRFEFEKWLVENNNTPWSFSKLRDAQKLSLIWIGVFAIIIVLLWRGIPCGRRTVLEPRDFGNGLIRDIEIRKWKWFPILWPFKMMTVLFHEICHAVVGAIIPPFARPVYIRVDPWEAGETAFKGNPNMAFTLPAGYVGSCAIGAALLWAGFDALTSKYAALGLAGGLAFALLVCFLVKPKLALSYRWHWIKMKWARWTGDTHTAVEQEKLDRKQVELDKARDRMVSLDTILFIAIILLAILFVAWYFSDSIALRFIILFLGVMSSLYAIVDVWVDGVVHKKDAGSDCRVFAEHYHRVSQKDEERVREGKYSYPEERSISRWTQYYAIVWLAIQIGILVTVVYFALRTFTSSMAQQAFDSRQFLPTSNSWQPADAWARAQKAGGSVGDKVDSWLDGVSTSYDEHFGSP